MYDYRGYTIKTTSTIGGDVVHIALAARKDSRTFGDIIAAHGHTIGIHRAVDIYCDTGRKQYC